MKVLLVNGSPKEKGCTYTALSEIAKTLEENGVETEIFHVGAKPVIGCVGCGACKKIGKCVYVDTVNIAAAKLDDVDGIVVGTPVHYAGASGAVTSFMDRLFMSAGAKIKYKPGTAIASCRRGGSTAALDQMNKYFTFNQMPLVSGSYWNMVHGSNPDEVKQDLEGLQNMRNIGRNMAWLLKCIKNGKENGINVPEQETPVRTSFIR